MNTFDNVVYKVSNLESSKAIHAALLDTEPHTDQPYYVGFNVAGVEIGLTPAQPGEATGAVSHVRVSDLDAALQQVRAAGADLVSEPHDVGGGTRIATVRDADGTVLGLIQRAG